MTMQTEKKQYLRRTLLVGFGFTLVFGSVFALIPRDNIAVMIAVLGVYVSVALSLLFRLIVISHHTADALGSTLFFSKDNDCRNIMEKVRGSLEYTQTKNDPIFTKMYYEMISAVGSRLEQATSGCIKLPTGELWRKHWERILSEVKIGEYRSTSWVKSPKYWRGPEGQACFEFNKSLKIETTRVFIIRDKFWNNPNIFEMIRDQYDAGIKVRVVRESVLKNNKDLLHDFGIYGRRAVGYQELNDNCETESFTFHFDEKTYILTERIFEGLLVYATEPETNNFLNKKSQIKSFPH